MWESPLPPGRVAFLGDLGCEHPCQREVEQLGVVTQVSDTSLYEEPLTHGR